MRLERIEAGLDGVILAKLEYLNPGGSKKDRAALGIIEAAEKSGQLRLGQTVVELTSGNAGTGLAIVCGVKGYPFVAVMSRGNSMERARMMAALGAEVVLVDQLPTSLPGQVSGGDLALVEREAQRITEERGAFRANQFHHPGNPDAHYVGTGREIWLQSGGAIDGFVDFVGSGGTLAGVSRALHEYNPAVRCFAVEPANAAVLAGSTVTNADHPIQGGGYAMPDLDFLQGAQVDGYVEVTGDEARAAARLLATNEGIFGGFSSGANLAATMKLLQGPMSGKTMVIVICDSGLKYLSTNLWAD